MIDDSDLERLERESRETEDRAFSAGRLFGVATMGALLSLGAYYVYHQLDPDKRARLKKKASGMIAEQIHALTAVRDPFEDEDDLH